jgi:outer membrane lipoprotein LolB
LRQITAAGLGLLTLLVSACATVPPVTGIKAEREAAYERRATRIAAWTQWGFQGRLSLDDGQDGGSGRLDWQTEGERSQLDFRGTLGRGAWRLSMQPGQASLQRADGSRAEASSVEQLVLSEVGWYVPVEALGWWVRGLRAPGPSQQIEFDAAGRIVRLAQAGWTIEFERYRAVAGTELPGRIEAVRGELRLKLVAARWTAPAGPDDSRA